MNIDFISQDFFSENTLDYNLEIREFDSYISIIVRDKVSGSQLAVRKTSEKGRENIKNEPLLLLQYCSVKIISKNLPFAFIPKEAFDIDRAGEFLPLTRLQQRRAKLQTVDFGKFVGVFDNRHNLEIVASIGLSITETHPIFELIGGRNLSVATDQILVEIADNRLYMACLNKEQDLVFANCFATNTVEESAYYILSVIQTTGFDTANCQINFGGESSQKLIELLQKYIDL